MDVTNDKSMVRAIQKIIEAEHKIDVLVNNAGYGSFGALEDVPISEAKYQFDVNVFGLACLTN
jgi:short-subunit dehydrogenase